ncbi:MAG: hypothetical protein QOF53_2614 [Nocardioidaceae bacterium]|jgi:hypothetical protein|nr:hypothetical protein [Nocardioidaceae bacterium]
MTGVARPRGPLPARVYWTRRLLLVAVAFALVFGIAHLLGGSTSGGNGSAPRPVDAEATQTTPTTSGPATVAGSPSVTPSEDSPTGTESPIATATSTALAQPTGRCANSDILAVPTVATPAYAGKPVALTLSLTTKQSPACNWTVGPGSLVVKVTSGTDRIWSSQDCVDAVPQRDVVVRKDHPVTVTVVWNDHRSDAECTTDTPWVGLGDYHVVAAAFGSDPTDRQFVLVPLPVATKTVTETPKPRHPSASPSAGATSTAR